MIKKIKRQFILYAVMIITFIIVVTLLLSLHRMDHLLFFHRYLIFSAVLIILVLIGSFFLSNIAVKPIQKAWQKQLDFTADASHELRTPLAVIQSNLEIVLEAPDSTVAEQLKWLKNIETESHRMNELVEALLTLSRADIGTNPPVLEDFPLHPLLSNKADVFQALATSKGVDIRIDIPEGFILHADYHKIDQLFTILIDNALKYMGRPGSVTIKAASSKKEFTIDVSDTGQGINEKDLSLIFQRFYRGDKSRSNLIKGSGLGLSIAQMIVNEHKGTIHVESTPNVGTTFHIRLPK